MGEPVTGYDCWIDIETGNWGLLSNLRLVRQEDLPMAISTEATPQLDGEARRALIRCAGFDHGIPAPRETRE